MFECRIQLFGSSFKHRTLMACLLGGAGEGKKDGQVEGGSGEGPEMINRVLDRRAGAAFDVFNWGDGRGGIRRHSSGRRGMAHAAWGQMPRVLARVLGRELTVLLVSQRRRR